MELKSKRSTCLWLVLLLLNVLSLAHAQTTSPTRGTGAEEAHTGNAAPSIRPDEWPLHGRTYAEDRHSPLAQINKANVEDLSLAWNYATGTRRGMEATPIVVDGVLYATGSWSIVYALDAATGEEIWRFDPKVPKNKGRDACCDVVNRGVALSKGRVFVGTIDGRLIALDAKTGNPIWDVATTDASRPYTITGAPRVIGDRVLIGNGGADLGVRGYVSAYNAATGNLEWRFYTVPASKDGPHEHPGLEEAARTWPANALWESGLGGTVWDSMAYDPELDLLYIGTGNASIYHRESRSPGGGDNLYLSSILALRPQTGELVWHYQTTPGDQWDYTATQQMILVDREWKGQPRKLLLQAPKNGFFYVLDRETGELLSAEKYAHVSWASHVDMETGRPVEREEADWNDKEAVVAPHVFGAHSWHPMSFDEDRGLVFMPNLALFYYFSPKKDFKFQNGMYQTGEDFAEMNDVGEEIEVLQTSVCSPSRLVAWNPATQSAAWEVRHDSPVAAGVLSTAGGLVFQGSSTGEFSAYDSDTGEKLWSDRAPVGIMAAPVSYQIGDDQYIAVVAGIGGAGGMNFAPKIDYVNAGQVLAWKLGGKASMPEREKRIPGQVQARKVEATQDVIDMGRGLYGENCVRCHGPGAVSSGLLPDLRYSSQDVYDNWNGIVLGGMRGMNGMASFADALTLTESNAIRAYVSSRAHREPTVIDWMLKQVADSSLCLPAEWATD
ncbi:MAG: PQQ-dependent dehydrogenase, methanol/ethanol family [Myxococcota bacterium]|nr:PQQ-dependent dehydrogenase, methanol/ethanol family [Myxococcota bacterium]